MLLSGQGAGYSALSLVTVHISAVAALLITLLSETLQSFPRVPLFLRVLLWAAVLSLKKVR